jgi:4-amino-4-deoxy-L-arabinose transferase-like glycosyltransferase
MRHRLAILAAMLALACAVQTWTIARAVVPAQDAIRYVLMAQAYQRDGLISGLKSEVEHPLFPMLVWLGHAAYLHMTGDPDNWAFCAQITAAAMLVLSVAFVYLLLVRLVGDAAAAAGTTFFCLMTPLARLGADALADSTQLSLFIAALYCIARSWRTQPITADDNRSQRGGQVHFAPNALQNEPVPEQPADRFAAAWLLTAGLSIGLALLARPEAAILAPALLLAIGWQQCSARSRQAWGPLAVGLAALAIGFAAVQAMYIATTASFSKDSLAARVMGRDPLPAAAPDVAATTGSRGWRTPDGVRMEFGSKDRSVSSRFAGHASAAAEYLRELPEAMQYWIGALAVAGMWQLRRARQRPFDRFALVLFVMHSLAAIHFAADLGYLSARHLAPLVPLALAPAGYAAVRAGNWLWRPCGSTSQMLGWATVVLAAFACLPRTLTPLHTSRIAHRQAGVWLATADQPGTVLDTRGWTALYSRRPTLRYDAAKTAYRLPGLAYVVVEQRELELDSARAKTLRHLLAGAAQRVAMFAAPRNRSEENVLIFRWHPERFTEELRVAKTR